MIAPVLHAIDPNIACRQNMPDVVFFCPGCRCEHGVWTSKAASNGARWTWNGDMVRPTFSPSLVVTTEMPQGREAPAKVVTRCHSFVRDGQIQFLDDCTHELRGKTVPLEPSQ